MISIPSMFDIDKILFASETATTVLEAVNELVAKAKEKGERAYLADAYLAGAYLADADLARAYLADAYLAGANLARAYLADAYLAGAYLAGANLARAYLADAYLAGADLARAYLAGADLAGADLAHANLAGANLAGANLAGANLADADLAGANLAGANLAGADLARANLADAYLAGANLARAYLADAYLAGAYLAGAKNVPSLPTTGEPVAGGVEARPPREPYKRATTPEERDAARLERRTRFREHHPEVPVIENLDSKIYEAVTTGGGVLNMANWHTCETTHCRAGWAIALAGDAGHKLERERGPFHAGAMIYRASTGRAPHFFASDERALADIKRVAALEQASLAAAAVPPPAVEGA